MSNVAIVEPRQRSVLVDMATRYGMEPQAFELTVRATCIKPDKSGRVASREEFAAFLLVAKKYDLNPLTKEIYAYPAKGGGVVPIVSIDGWANLINRHPQFDGMEFDDHQEGDGLSAITCRMFRKDRGRPVSLTEYMVECRRDSDTWRQWPRRMLRHKAMIQTARYTFGFAGIYDEDEGERIVGARDASPYNPRRLPPAPPPVATPSPPASPEASPEPSQAQQAPFDFDAFRAELAKAETLDALNAAFERLTSRPMTSEEIDETDAILREVAEEFWKSAV